MATDQDRIRAMFGGGAQAPDKPAAPAAAPKGAEQEPPSKPPLTVGVRTRSRTLATIPTDYETRHVLLLGTTGSGKSQAIYNLLKTIRARGEPALIMDHGGETLQRFYRPGKDNIFNPFDKRSKKWGVFAEARRSYDWAKIAKFIVQDGQGDAASWHGRAQNLLANAMKQLAARGKMFQTTSALLEYLLRAELYGKDDPTSLESLMVGTSSERLFAPGSDRPLTSVLGIVSDALTAMEHLLLREKGENDGDFAMADWVKDPGDSWTFLSYTDASFAAIQPLFRILVASAIQNVMELRPDSSRRFYFVLDELASLGRVPHFTDALAKFRKYGGCVIAGFQSISQIEDDELYGVKGAQTLMSCFNTQVLLRTMDAATAEAQSLLVGAELLDEKSKSETQQQNGDSSIGTSTQKQERRTIMPRVFQDLADLRGYALIGGTKGVQEIEVPYANLQPITVAEDTDDAIYNI